MQSPNKRKETNSVVNDYHLLSNCIGMLEEPLCHNINGRKIYFFYNYSYPLLRMSKLENFNLQIETKNIFGFISHLFLSTEASNKYIWFLLIVSFFYSISFLSTLFVETEYKSLKSLSMNTSSFDKSLIKKESSVKNQ